MPSTKKVDMDNMRQLFREFDTNGDGFIQKNELRDVMTKLSAGVPPTDEELDQMFDAADANHDGNIDFNEFLTIARSNPGTMTLRDMFAQFDKDDDGYITPMELQQGFAMMGQHLTDYDTKLIFDHIDQNKDEKIDFKEFCRLMDTK